MNSSGLMAISFFHRSNVMRMRASVATQPHSIVTLATWAAWRAATPVAATAPRE